MKKWLPFSAVILATLALSGCASSAEGAADAACREEVEGQVGDGAKFSDVEIQNVLDFLYAEGSIDERDSSKDEFQMVGTVTSNDGSVEQRQEFSCYVLMDDGSVSSVSVDGL